MAGRYDKLGHGDSTDTAPAHQVKNEPRQKEKPRGRQ
jgi:hypothetical protein